jgi:ParB/RepB/Spo0J family partition protein
MVIARQDRPGHLARGENGRVAEGKEGQSRGQGRAAAPQVIMIPVGRLRPDPANRPDNSGDEDLAALARTIDILGMLHPISVAPHPSREGYYLIKAGERRWRAAQIAGWPDVPAIVRPRLSGSVGSALARVVENCQRADHGPVEMALAFGTLLDEGMTQAGIAELTGIPRGTVSYYVQLLKADEGTLNRVRRGELPAGSVREAVKAASAAGTGPGPVKPRTTRTAPRRSARKRPAPRHFSATHPLAAAAHDRCQADGHPASERYGMVACGPCWEAAIRADVRAGGGLPLVRPARPLPAPSGNW